MKVGYGSSWLVLAVLLSASATANSSTVDDDTRFLSAAAAVSLTDEWAKTDSAVANNPVIWPGKLRMPVSLGLTFAVVWILLLGSVPVLVHVLDHRPVTKTGLVMAALMWTALFGGLYIFTNVVLFRSPHFDQVRSLTVIECIYFMSQIITTVGYGDVLPTTQRAQVVVCIYAVLAILIIAELISEMFKVVNAAANKFQDDLVEEFAHSHQELAHTHRLIPRPSAPSLWPLFLSFLMFCSCAMMFILFFHYWPGEEKAWLEATYMAIITMSTIGFGAVTPVTEEGMVFGAFFFLIGALALARLIVDFSSFMMELAIYERFDPLKFQDQMKENARGDQMTEADFLSFTLLQNNILPDWQLEAIRLNFRSLNPVKGSVCIHHLCDHAVGIKQPVDVPEMRNKACTEQGFLSSDGEEEEDCDSAVPLILDEHTAPEDHRPKVEA